MNNSTKFGIATAIAAAITGITAAVAVKDAQEDIEEASATRTLTTADKAKIVGCNLLKWSGIPLAMTAAFGVSTIASYRAQTRMEKSLKDLEEVSNTINEIANKNTVDCKEFGVTYSPVNANGERLVAMTKYAEGAFPEELQSKVFILKELEGAKVGIEDFEYDCINYPDLETITGTDISGFDTAFKSASCAYLETW